MITLKNIFEEITAFHGSPHAFTQFSTDHIGKREGAGEFGWGIYFTDIHEIAKYYKNTLSKKGKGKIYNVTLFKGLDTSDKDFLFWYKPLPIKLRSTLGVDLLSKALRHFFENPSDLYFHKDIVFEETYFTDNEMDESVWEVYDKKMFVVKTLKDEQTATDYTYLLNLHAMTMKLAGSQIYEILSNYLGSPKQASEFLTSKNILGIKFPTNSFNMIDTYHEDGNNYVVFSDKHITIEKL